MNLINQGFMSIFDGNYEQAVQMFRQILTFKPGNFIAANNLATCKIFMNQVSESIRALESVIKTGDKNSQSLINEQAFTNLNSMYELNYATNAREKKDSLLQFCQA